MNSTSTPVLDAGTAELAAAPNAVNDVRLAAVRGGAVAAFLELGKARLSALVVLTTAVGFVLASPEAIDWPRLALTLLGTTLAALGANAFNQIIEAQRDARMVRTRGRPLPSGRLSRWQALAFAFAAGAGGPLLLALTVNLLTSALAAACLLIYVLAYTPLKVRSTSNTLVGAVCGAIPPMMGWAAVANELPLAAWVLGAILFVWQIPHFLALAWLYRDDYERGGFRMLPVIDRDGRLTCQATVLYSLTLIPVTLMLTTAGATGSVYALGAILLGAALAVLGVRLYRARTRGNARVVFLASVIYLPLLLGLMVADRVAQPAQVVLSSAP